MGRFSDQRSFLGGAISTAASPLRNGFVEVNCRSPVTPRRIQPPSSHGPERLWNINTNPPRYGAYSNLPYLPTPRGFSLTESGKDQAGRHDNYISSSTTLISPSTSSSFLPLTPSFPAPPVEKLGTFSAINIILGKTVGVGIYSIPSSILTSVGSVGACITLWILGSLISYCGLAVYLDLGTGIPRSGGERVYLERIFTRPRMLATCCFMAYVVLLGFSTPNCIVLGEYVMTVAVGVITLTCVIHAKYQKLGLRIINVLGVGKMLILVIVILSGLAGAFMGVGSSNLPSLERRRLSLEVGDTRSTAQRNFSNLFAGSSTQPHDYATALLKILYCFRGYSTANNVLSSLHNPIPTLRVAAPVALSLVSIGYILANISYFLVVELSDFRSSGTVIAGHFFKTIFGELVGENILPLFIIVSAFGNIAATSFAQARVNQELGRDGLLPFPRFWSLPHDLDPPLAGLALHWLVSVLVIIIPPPGAIYEFLVDIGGYPVSVISVAISLGLLYLQTSPREHWNSPFRARKIYTLVFAASNCLLLVMPWIRPDLQKGDPRFPYYAYPATALAVLGTGVLYWIWWAHGRRLEMGMWL
ncbi:hypothetical protein M430DRAFT_65200 [Amorphotheca resinae ATCC 22711]|uniref:Amino acid transporter transmembrane domain-containing protein n=1 Tax=Amorphotheca resinae ATCC 22711 TaxID=857342 RepID=A0A2T3B5C8_AMORE|nr:hypothetical protein M430DRAFT_65200 [Amorphotheca resinae ATCC 22711]PSS21964.1 hypothetical protein M430DRAFT_65200 [Amorphotheca resinae ATCC 22711]